MKLKSLFVLAISSIAFLSSCGCSNNPDRDFLNKINNLLASKNDIYTCHDAIHVLEANDLDVLNYQLKDVEQEFVYDFDAKQFIVMKNDSIVFSPAGYKKNENTFSYFKFTNIYDGNSIYSQYLLDSFPQTENLIVTTGIDVGNHKDIKNVTYAGSVGLERNIKIRVYCDYLTIIADSDNVSYYGNANNIFVSDVKTFDVYGANSYVQLRDGTTNFKKGSSTDFLEVPNNYISEITATQEDGALIYCAINKPEGITAPELPVTEINNLTDFKNALIDSNKPFIRLTGDIIDTEESGFSIDTVDKVIDLNGFSISTTKQIEIDEKCYLIDTEYAYNENCGIVLSGNDANIYIDGYLLMNGGNVIATNIFRSAITVADDGIFDMYGGRITVNSNSNNSYAIVTGGEEVSVNINYATITSNGSIFGNTDGATLNINAGTFISEGEFNNCFQIYGGTTNIYGGTFSANTCIRASDSQGDDLTINIYGGSFYSRGHYTEGEGILGSTIVVEDRQSAEEYSCTINIDNALLYSRYGYICSVYGAGKTNVAVNCNSGTYDYYLGNGVSVLEGLEDYVTIKQNGDWINHEYA